MMKGLLTGAIVVAFALVCWIVETWTDRRFPQYGDAVFVLIITSGVAIIAIAAVIHFGRLA
jgi:hypothetical protein